jgi:phosphoribosyl-dephospho-CoA transferase
MTFTPRPHDLLWLNNANALLTVEEAWVAPSGTPVCRWWCGAM